MKVDFQKIFFISLVLLITVIFFGLIGGFFLALFWAVIFAIIFHRRYEQILSKMPTKPNTATALTIGGILLIVIIPIIIFGLAVFLESEAIVNTITESTEMIEEQVEELQDQLPLNDKQLRHLGITSREIETKIVEIKDNGIKYLAERAISFSQNILSVVVNFALMIYILFFFMRDGKRLVQQLRWGLPLQDQKEIRLLKRFESVARATVKGSLVVAIVQGAAGGLLFFLLGIPAPFLWGAIMMVCSLLPIGSGLVWGPWVLVLFGKGDYTGAIILLVLGAGFIGLIDNFLRPRLVGKDSKMPDYLVLLSTLGGLYWVGLSGFVLGPIIAALFTTCWYMVGQEYEDRAYQQVVTEPSAEELAKGK
ncbi:AI-2E family transporter [Flavilitoribacter nigricans]|uniref:AI-2E family transporter n=1 Tax=Flavilitoribacter nigricans (strain ATCC 23147 / DSM 23189 / NBRC 102662 / NCIMB 1420 / SS-2) TaxID=1122177 RepID=A0A2D0N0R3_FLAN2|nr:AI-2E family transporter [Flavilitoribacter nigricans]PHN02104.1 AI-2E family transporter [Flavilitoribacter nigricans DSM 23189 = NBRC 102662]